MVMSSNSQQDMSCCNENALLQWKMPVVVNFEGQTESSACRTLTTGAQATIDTAPGICCC